MSFGATGLSFLVGGILITRSLSKRIAVLSGVALLLVSLLRHDHSVLADEGGSNKANSFKATHARAEEFDRRDQDHNDRLSEDEFVAGGGADEPVLRRDFRLFDFDRDRQMTFEEFITVPFGQPDSQRGILPEPVITMSRNKQTELLSNWKGWDTDHDDRLSSAEFVAAAVGALVPGLASTKFSEWDLNNDGYVTRNEIPQVLDIAYGVTDPQGVLLRTNTGRVLDWIMFRGLKKDSQGMVSKEDYFQILGPEFTDREIWYAMIDQNRDGRFDFAEFSHSNHATDAVFLFRKLDTDLNGLLSSDELDSLPNERFPVAYFLLPAFDDDADGSLSLAEFQFSPVCNLLAPWQSARDKNEDGQLTFEEFRFDAGVMLSALSREYFDRLDRDRDQSLSPNEFPFITNHPDALQRELWVQSDDGVIQIVTIPDYPNIGSPQLSTDGKWVAVDGAKEGQNDRAAHVLLIELATEDVLDLGSGCLPHWSADGRRVAYSKYSGGVFLRDRNANADEEEHINASGWSISYSPDGKQFAYIQGSNIVIQDLKSGARRMLFTEGQSPFGYITFNFAWSPDGQRMSFIGNRENGKKELAVVSTTGDDLQLRILCDAEGISPQLAWHPDGKRVFFPKSYRPDRTVQIFEKNVLNDEPPTRYSPQPRHRNVAAYRWSADGHSTILLTLP